MKDVTISVLLTCFNRRDTTIKCLKKLNSFHLPLDIYVVDDGSTDGTSLQISQRFPEVNLIVGSGNLFWNRGMYLAWQEAAKKDYDFYIWLNDDVLLYDTFFEELLACSKVAEHKAIISGLVESHDGNNIIYGGYDFNKKLITSTGFLSSITNLNGNIVLVPKSVFKILGNLDPVFHHDLGDVDYGLRAKKQNINVYTTRIAIGSGDSNAPCRVRLWNSNVRKRFKKLNTPLGSPPSINFYFRKRHFGILNAVMSFCFNCFINLLPDNVIRKLFGDKYM